MAADREQATEVFSTKELRMNDIRGINGFSSDTVSLKSNLTIQNSVDFSFATTNGTKLGTAANQKLGFFGATPVVQVSGVAVDAAGIHAALVTLGLITA